ncbi:response regulator, partial [bacterium]|nr:response regulator [bacterium]
MAPSILIIDFEQNDLVRMTNALAQAGYVVRTALQSADGLDLFREFAPDLVFVNVLMPGTNGPQVCDRIKDRSRDTAVYFVSSIATGSLGPMLRKSRSDGALKKPLDPAKLVEIAEKHIGPGDPELVRQHREREA